MPGRRKTLGDAIDNPVHFHMEANRELREEAKKMVIPAGAQYKWSPEQNKMVWEVPK